MGTHYDRIDRTSIVLAAGDFSPDGVLQYTLPTPMPFQSGDVLGIYQPRNRVVRLYHFTESNAPVIYNSQSDNASTLAIGNSNITDQRILLSVETSKLQF